MRADELWFSPAPGAVAARIALTPASWLYAFGWRMYALTYRLGFKKAQHPFTPILCVGNLVVGGTGKTPTTLAIARMLGEMGEKVVIGLSGYGSPRAEAATVAPEGLLEAAEWGDEPAMMRWLLPEVPLIVGRRRVLAAELAAQSFPGHVLLMDDGFQHLPLRKDISILLDAENPANRRCLPAGPYREPRTNRKSADLILGLDFGLERAGLTFQNPKGEVQSTPSQADVLCALGHPAGFLKALEQAGVRVRASRLLPDHDTLTAGNLFEGLNRDLPLLVTAKDWVKLRDRSDLNEREVLIALQEAEIEPREAFKAWLAARLAKARNS